MDISGTQGNPGGPPPSPEALVNLEGSQHQCVNWRPQVLILYRINMSEELQGIKHHEILSFCSQLRKSRGFCVVACVLESETRDEATLKRAAYEKSVIKGIIWARLAGPIRQTEREGPLLFLG